MMLRVLHANSEDGISPSSQEEQYISVIKFNTLMQFKETKTLV
jgi:hypothetical protein